MPQIWNYTVKGCPQGAPTPDPLSRHVCGGGGGGAEVPAAVQLSSIVRFTELHQFPPKSSKIAEKKVLKFRCLEETKTEE